MEALVDDLATRGVVSTPEVCAAMRATDRAKYMPGSHYRAESYYDTPMGIGHGQTISAPHMHGYCLELLALVLLSRPGEPKVALDVGCGSGFLTACLARMAPEVTVYGIELKDALVALAQRNIEGDAPELLASGRVVVQKGDGWRGLPERAPFDVIHVGATADSLPQELVEQLKPGGRMVVPIGSQHGDQWLEQVDKAADGSVHRERILAVRYVPLVHADGCDDR